MKQKHCWLSEVFGQGSCALCMGKEAFTYYISACWGLGVWPCFHINQGQRKRMLYLYCFVTFPGRQWNLICSLAQPSQMWLAGSDGCAKGSHHKEKPGQIWLTDIRDGLTLSSFYGSLWLSMAPSSQYGLLWTLWMHLSTINCNQGQTKRTEQHEHHEQQQHCDFELLNS